MAHEDVPPQGLLAQVLVLAPPATAVRSLPSNDATGVPSAASVRLSRLRTTLVVPWTAQNTRVKWIAVGGLMTRIRPLSPTTGARSMMATVRVMFAAGRSAVVIALNAGAPETAAKRAWVAVVSAAVTVGADPTPPPRIDRK